MLSRVVGMGEGAGRGVTNGRAGMVTVSESCVNGDAQGHVEARWGA